jgi:hypothetical protein
VSNDLALPPGRWVPGRWGVLHFKPTTRPRIPAEPQFCGTERGYQWHRHNDSFNWPLPPDDPCGCRAAHRAHRAFLMEMRKREQEAS